MGMIQGGSNEKMRQWSTQQTVARGVSSYMLCGLGRAKQFEDALKAVRYSVSMMPADKLRYVQGNFSPEQVIELVRAGIDLIHSTQPQKLAEQGVALTFKSESQQQLAGNVNVNTTNNNNGINIAGPFPSYFRTDLNDASFTQDLNPIDSQCPCFACRNHTRGYVHHLLETKEMLAHTLLATHNIRQFQSFFRALREKISQAK